MTDTAIRIFDTKNFGGVMKKYKNLRDIVFDLNYETTFEQSFKEIVEGFETIFHCVEVSSLSIDTQEHYFYEEGQQRPYSIDRFVKCLDLKVAKDALEYHQGKPSLFVTAYIHDDNNSQIRIDVTDLNSRETLHLFIRDASEVNLTNLIALNADSFSQIVEQDKWL